MTATRLTRKLFVVFALAALLVPVQGVSSALAQNIEILPPDNDLPDAQFCQTRVLDIWFETGDEGWWFWRRDFAIGHGRGEVRCEQAATFLRVETTVAITKDGIGSRQNLCMNRIDCNVGAESSKTERDHELGNCVVVVVDGQADGVQVPEAFDDVCF